MADAGRGIGYQPHEAAHGRLSAMGEEPPKSEPTLEEGPSTTATTDAAAISHTDAAAISHTDAAAISDTGAAAISHTNKHVNLKPRAETDPHCPTGGDHNVDLEMTDDESVGAKTNGNDAGADAGTAVAEQQAECFTVEGDLWDDFYDSLLPNIAAGTAARFWDSDLVTKARLARLRVFLLFESREHVFFEQQDDLLRRGTQTERRSRRYPGRHRKYDNTLKVEGEYCHEKRSVMLKINYVHQTGDTYVRR